MYREKVACLLFPSEISGETARLDLNGLVKKKINQQMLLFYFLAKILKSFSYKQRLDARDLKKLVDKGVLESQGNGPETYYILSRYEPIAKYPCFVRLEGRI